VITYSRGSRAKLGALMVCCAILPLLSACSLYNRVFHGRSDAGCTEKPFALNTDVRPPLKVPEGMSAPDTRNAVKVPELAVPQRTRAKSEPCLSRPPSYFDKPLTLYVAPKPPPKPKKWWQFWRKAPPPPAPTSPSAAEPPPAPPPAPAPTPSESK
jgi:hypothetical protein